MQRVLEAVAGFSVPGPAVIQAFERSFVERRGARAAGAVPIHLRVKNQQCDEYGCWKNEPERRWGAAGDDHKSENRARNRGQKPAIPNDAVAALQLLARGASARQPAAVFRSRRVRLEPSRRATATSLPAPMN